MRMTLSLACLYRLVEDDDLLWGVQRAIEKRARIAATLVTEEADPLT